jgi:hypothetical protein
VKCSVKRDAPALVINDTNDRQRKTGVVLHPNQRDRQWNRDFELTHAVTKAGTQCILRVMVDPISEIAQS